MTVQPIIRIVRSARTHCDKRHVRKHAFRAAVVANVIHAAVTMTEITHIGAIAVLTVAVTEIAILLTEGNEKAEMKAEIMEEVRHVIVHD